MQGKIDKFEKGHGAAVVLIIDNKYISPLLSCLLWWFISEIFLDLLNKYTYACQTMTWNTQDFPTILSGYIRSNRVSTFLPISSSEGDITVVICGMIWYLEGKIVILFCILHSNLPIPCLKV